VDYWDAWHRACAAADLSGRISDFRRTAACNLIAAGVYPFTTCQLVGWEGPAMLKRSNIVNHKTLKWVSCGITSIGASAPSRRRHR
jgi:hypothetical protein